MPWNCFSGRRIGVAEWSRSLPMDVMAVRAETGLVRPPPSHGCAPCEIIPGLWTAHFDDIGTAESLAKVLQPPHTAPALSAAAPLRSPSPPSRTPKPHATRPRAPQVAPAVTCVVNAGTDTCPARDGSYGERVRVVTIDGLLDDPDERKAVDAMAEGSAKDAAKAALPDFAAELRAGDAMKDFERVNSIINATIANGGAAMVQSRASISRSAAFILAYLVSTENLSLVDAIRLVKSKWSAGACQRRAPKASRLLVAHGARVALLHHALGISFTSATAHHLCRPAVWPNDTFLRQLIAYEAQVRPNHPRRLSDSFKVRRVSGEVD